MMGTALVLFTFSVDRFFFRGNDDWVIKSSGYFKLLWTLNKSVLGKNVLRECADYGFWMEGVKSKLRSGGF